MDTEGVHTPNERARRPVSKKTPAMRKLFERGAAGFGAESQYYKMEGRRTRSSQDALQTEVSARINPLNHFICRYQK